MDIRIICRWWTIGLLSYPVVGGELYSGFVVPLRAVGTCWRLLVTGKRAFDMPGRVSSGRLGRYRCAGSGSLLISCRPHFFRRCSKRIILLHPQPERLVRPELLWSRSIAEPSLVVKPVWTKRLHTVNLAVDHEVHKVQHI